MGVKLVDGKNDVVIKYRSPWQNAGYIVTLLGIVALVFVLIGEKKYAEKAAK